MSPTEPRLANQPVILASQSPSRFALLKGAGLNVTRIPARVDEEAVRESLEAEGASARDMADLLAELKARNVSERERGAFVIGADQILECEGRLYAKPADRAAAARHLAEFSGKTHTLLTAACVARDGEVLWRTLQTPRLTMRPLSSAFIETYLDATGEAVLGSVGVYHLEGLGAQLFTRIEGDYFAILGLPLIPLLDFLRRHNIVPT